MSPADMEASVPCLALAVIVTMIWKFGLEYGM